MEAYCIWLDKEKSPGSPAVTRSFVMIRRYFLFITKSVSILMKKDLVLSIFFFIIKHLFGSLSYPIKHTSAHLRFNHAIQLNLLIINNYDLL